MCSLVSTWILMDMFLNSDGDDNRREDAAVRETGR